MFDQIFSMCIIALGSNITRVQIMVGKYRAAMIVLLRHVERQIGSERATSGALIRRYEIRGLRCSLMYGKVKPLNIEVLHMPCY